MGGPGAGNPVAPHPDGLTMSSQLQYIRKSRLTPTAFMLVVAHSPVLCCA